jgi:hypothetical protein
VEQLNISQLRNLWLRSPDERLAGWREFRIELQSSYDCDRDVLSSLTAISTWWQQAPIVSVALDPFNSKSWPTVWEIIYQGECCKYSRGLAMAYNIHYIDPKADVAVHRVHDHQYGDEYMIATWGSLAVNSQHGQIVDLHDVESIEIRESFLIDLCLLQNQ